MMIRRFVLTGAPGVGKTTIAEALRARGRVVVREAATDVIAAGREGDGFVDAVLELQLARERAATGAVQVLDRSPLCTLALARYLGVRPSAALHSAVAGAAERYAREVFVVQPLGFITPTAARRISYPDSLRFAAVHEQVYRDYGFTLVQVPKAAVTQRVALIERYLEASGSVAAT
jgi:predicted ATPase